MTSRGTDWALALLVTVGLTSGLATWFAGARGDAWVYALHAIAGAALAGILVFKLRRVLPALRRRARADPQAARGMVGLVLVAVVLCSGVLWSTTGPIELGGYSLLVWHALVGALLGPAVLAHARLRGKRLRRRDVADRRQFLVATAVGGAALVLWQLQRPLQRALGLGGGARRFTGSYDAGSFTGNRFPATSWVADRPRPIDDASYRLAVGGRVRRPLSLAAAALDRGDDVLATLDCTGGFYSTQRWRGLSVGRLLDEAGVLSDARHLRVISHTGYRWSFELADARALLLATHVGNEALTHEHGGPCRLVAPGRRGFAWVKWVERIEVHRDADPGALASTVWSSFTDAGRGV